MAQCNTIGFVVSYCISNTIVLEISKFATKQRYTIAYKTLQRQRNITQNATDKYSVK